MALEPLSVQPDRREQAVILFLLLSEGRAGGQDPEFDRRPILDADEPSLNWLLRPPHLYRSILAADEIDDMPGRRTFKDYGSPNVEIERVGAFTQLINVEVESGHATAPALRE